MTPSPALKAARKRVRGIKGLSAKPAAGGRILYYWEPNRAEKEAGWKPLKFGDDQAAAIRGSDIRNAEVEAWRKGVAPPSADTAIAPVLAPPRHAAFLTLAHHAALYERNHLAHKSINHQKSAGCSLRKIVAHFGDMLPSDIQPHHIADWTDAMRGRGVHSGKGRKLSDSTASNRMRTLKALLNWIKNPHERFSGTARHQIWEADDEAAFIAAAYDLGFPSMAFAMELAIYSGQRSQDLIAFTEAQLQEMQHLINRNDHAALADKNGKVWGWQLIQMKSEKEGSVPVQMHIPFQPDMLAKVQSHIARNRARDRAEGRLLTYVLVDDRTGEPWKGRKFVDAWHKVNDHAIARTGRTGMDDLHWHDLRRTRVVRLKRQGYSHDRIASLTGHSPSSVDTIMKVYGPVDPNMTTRLIVDSQKREQGAG